MNLDLDTVIENILRDTGVWDIKLIRIRQGSLKNEEKKYRFFLSILPYGTVSLTRLDFLQKKIKK